jgi:lipid A 3-O-deacylase
MNLHHFLASGLSLLCFLLSPVVLAEESSAMAFSAGAFDVFDNDDTAAEFGLEYRFAPMDSAYNLIPVIGLTVNSDGGYWAHTGVRYDFHLNENWVLTPNFAVAAYEDGAGKDLGHVIEFRTGLELAYKLDASSHLGLGIYHLSNAGLDDKNPGEESLILSYSFSPDF